MTKRNLIVVIAIFGVTAILTLIATSFLYGGFGNLAKNLKSMPNPQSGEVALQRENVKSELTKEFMVLEQNVNLSNTGSEFLDECYRGQNNGKVNQGFAYRCSYRITRYYGFNNDFKAQMTNYLNGLANLGWDTNSSYHTESIAMTYDYYGNMPVESASNKFLNGGVPAKKGSLEMDINYQDVRYLRNGLYDSQNVMLRATGDNTYVNKQLVNIDAAVDAIAKNNQYLLKISIEKDYFQN